jgi:hypothetical protein
MSDQLKRDQNANRISNENEKRHQEAIQDVARRNEAAHKEAKKLRAASDRLKIELRRRTEAR